MHNCFLDTETCGLHGPIVCIQYDMGDGIQVHHVWYEPIWKTMELLDKIMECRIIAYNLAFDWFHINKLFNMLYKSEDWMLTPIDNIDYMIELEEMGRDGFCLKPKSCFDLMLFMRKGPYQSTMGIKPVVIRNVPRQTSTELCDILEKSFNFDPVYFAGFKKKTKRWGIKPSENKPGFDDVRLIFSPKTDLKTMAEFVLGRKRKGFKDVMPDEFPVELGYAPYAKAIINAKEWPTLKPPVALKLSYCGTWPRLIEDHAEHWKYIPAAIYYSEMDVQDLIDLHEHFEIDESYYDDDDSTLAAMAGAVRWKGFAIDQPKMAKLRKALELLVDKKVPYRASKACTRYLLKHMSDDQKEVWDGKTAGKQLESMEQWEGPIGLAAKNVLEYRQWQYLIDLTKKFSITDRFHASVKVIGAKSTRMSGADGINAQGIPNIDDIRDCFTFAFLNEQLAGGDFSAFEVGIFLATCREGELSKQVKEGKKIHALYGLEMYPEMTYDEIRATEHTEDDKYTRSKSGLFLNMYGGSAYGMHKNLGIPIERAEAGIKGFGTTYPEVGEAQREATLPYEALAQSSEGGVIEWTEPKDHIESLLGFKRYFHIEIEIMRRIFELAENPPDDWSTERVYRRKDGTPQTASGSTRSALFGAAFSIQNSIQRIAGNHRIQSTGAGILKQVQRKVWDLQPTGIGAFAVRTLNIHDELITVSKPGLCARIEEIVQAEVEILKDIVPLLNIEWGEGKTWAQVH